MTFARRAASSFGSGTLAGCPVSDPQGGRLSTPASPMMAVGSERRREHSHDEARRRRNERRRLEQDLREIAARQRRRRALDRLRLTWDSTPEAWDELDLEGDEAQEAADRFASAVEDGRRERRAGCRLTEVLSRVSRDPSYMLRLRALGRPSRLSAPGARPRRPFCRSHRSQVGVRRARSRSPGRPSGDDDPPSRPPLTACREAGP